MSGDALALLGGLVLENGHRWGETAHDFQRADARAILDESPEAERFHFLTRPRGASKTTDLGGIVLCALLDQAPRLAKLYALASDRDQGRLLLDSIEGFVERTEGLGAEVRTDKFTVTATRSNAQIQVLAADEAGSWGLRPWFVVIDEIAQWATTAGPQRLWEAIFSAAPKVPGSRMAVLTSAGAPEHWSYRVLQHARSDASGLWRTSELPGPTPWIPERDLEDQRRLLPESSYRRLHLNEWTSAEDRLTTVDDLEACATLEVWPRSAEPGFWYVIALDVGLKNDRTVAAVLHAEIVFRSGREELLVVLDRMAVWQGNREAAVDLSTVRSWVEQASDDFGGAHVVFDPYQAVGLAQELEVRGVSTHEFTFTSASVGRLAAALHQQIRTHLLALPAQDDAVPESVEIHRELANVRLVERSPGVLRLDHDAGQHDDRAVAIAMGVFFLREHTLTVFPDPEPLAEPPGISLY